MALFFVYSPQEWTVLLEHEDLGLLSILGNVKPLSLQILLFLIPFHLYLQNSYSIHVESPSVLIFQIFSL